MKFKEGDYIKIIEREQTPADVKSGTYYPHYSGTTGTVERVYDEEVCIKVDIDTLPDDARKRHLEIQESMKRKWLDGLSGEARNRLSPEEKQFQLAYTVLVQTTDVEKAKPGATKSMPAPQAKAITAPASMPGTEAPAETAPAVNKAPGKAKDDSVKPVTPKDLEAAELAFLKEREKALKQSKDA